jgi:hypothetical protein
MSRVMRRDGRLVPNKVEPRHRVAAWNALGSPCTNYQLWWRDGETLPGRIHSSEDFNGDQVAWMDGAAKLAQQIADLDPMGNPVEDKDANTVVTIGMLRMLFGRAEDIEALQNSCSREPLKPSPLLEALEDKFPR